MKASKSSPHPEFVRVRAFRYHSAGTSNHLLLIPELHNHSAMRPSNSIKKRIRAVFSPKKAYMPSEPPRLENLEFLPNTMSLDGIPGVSSEETTSITMNGSSPATRASRFIDLPARQSLTNGNHFSSPPPSESDGMRSPSAFSSQPGTPTNESAPGW